MTWLLLLLVFAGPVGWVATLIRRDHNRAAAAEARAEKAEHRAAVERARADEADHAAREWMAVAQDRGADLIEHGHRCLGELVYENDGVKP